MEVAYRNLAKAVVFRIGMPREGFYTGFKGLLGKDVSFNLVNPVQENNAQIDGRGLCG